MIIDAHSHLGPAFAHHPPLLPGTTADQIVDILDRAGIDKALTFAPQWEGPHFVDPEFRAANRAIYEATREFPDRLIGVARIDPNRRQKAIDEMRRCHDDYSFQALKLHPMWEHFLVNNFRLLDPVMEKCEEYAWPTFWHTGYYPTCQPALFMDLAARFPRVNMVLFHLSYAHTADAIIAARRFQNIYLETAGNSSAAAIAEVLRSVPATQFLYGSDLPYHKPDEVIAKITKQPGLQPDVKRLVLGGNVARLLGMAEM